MIEINKMFHTKTGEIIFEDINGQWWTQEYQNYGPYEGDDWYPVVVTKIDNPEQLETK